MFDEHREAGSRVQVGRRQTGGGSSFVPMLGQRDPVTGKGVRGPTGVHSPISREFDDILERAVGGSPAG